MRKTVKAVMILTAAASLAACETDERIFSSGEFNTVIEASSEAPLPEGPDSRTAVDPAVNTSGEIGVNWMPGDKIGVFTDGTKYNNVCFENKNTSETAKTSFTGNIGTSTPKYAYYPYSESAGTNFTGVKGNLPLIQHYNTSTRVLEGDWKVGTPQNGETTKFNFKHIFAFLRFEINAEGTEIDGESLQSVSLTIPGTQLGGDFTCNLQDRSVSFSKPTDDTDVSKVTMEWTDTPALSASTFYGYMNVAPVTDIKGKTMTVEIKTNAHTITFNTTLTASALVANRYYNVPLTLSRFKESWTITDNSGTPDIPAEPNAKWLPGLQSKLACANTVFAIQGEPFMHKIRVPSYPSGYDRLEANVKPYMITPDKDGVTRVYNLPDGLTWNNTRKLVEGTAPAAGDYIYSVEFVVDGQTYKEGIKLHVAATSDGLLSPTPIIGWQTWNVLGEDINETKLTNQLKGMQTLGLIEAGYKYFGIDDAWQLRDLDGNGHQQINTESFETLDGVNGMKRMADKIHSYGLKAGIYTDCGRYTCGGGGNAYAGSYGHEATHAQDYKDWGYDFVKEDWYYNTNMAPGTPFTPGYNGVGQQNDWNSKAKAQELYTKMGTALANRGIILYMCEWGIHDPWKWGAETGATCWRMSYDDSNAWKATNELTYGANEGVNNNRVGVYTSIVLMRNLWPYVGINRYNDADMLCVGIDGSAKKPNGEPVPGNEKCFTGAGLTEAEAQTAFAMWCMWSSPILLGFDMTQNKSTIEEKLGYDAVGLLCNTKMVAIQQDPLGQGAEYIKTANGCDYYMKDLAGGDVAIAVVNLGESQASYTISLPEYDALDSSKSYSATNLLTKSDAGTLSAESSLSGSIEKHGTFIIRLTKK